MTIDELFLDAAKHGVKRITFGIDNNSQPVVACDQQVAGTRGLSMIQHQCTGTSFDDAAREMTRRALLSDAMQKPHVLPVEGD